MNIIELYDRIDARIKKLVNKGKDEKEAKALAWEEYFKEICDKGMVRNIAQNFTTQWYRLFDIVEKIHCNSCNQEIYLGKSEERVCPNPQCGATI